VNDAFTPPVGTTSASAAGNADSAPADRVVIVAVVVTAYSIMGGLWSVTLTDFVQVFLIVIGMIIAIPFALNYAGGWSSVTANIEPGTLSMFKGYDVFGIISLVVMYTATFSVGQEAVSRFYAAKDEKAAKGGAWMADGLYHYQLDWFYMAHFLAQTICFACRYA
jgi:Na+/proline symporter